MNYLIADVYALVLGLNEMRAEVDYILGINYRLHRLCHLTVCYIGLTS